MNVNFHGAASSDPLEYLKLKNKTQKNCTYFCTNCVLLNKTDLSCGSEIIFKNKHKSLGYCIETLYIEK